MESCTSCYDPVMAGRKYLNDYEIVTQPDKHGRETTKLEYRGDFFEVLFQKGDLARYRKTSLLVLMIKSRNPFVNQVNSVSHGCIKDDQGCFMSQSLTPLYFCLSFIFPLDWSTCQVNNPLTAVIR